MLKGNGWLDSREIHSDQFTRLSPTTNFLGEASHLGTANRRTLLSYLPSQSLTESFIECYLTVVEPPHQILHAPSFKEEVQAFWNRPSAVKNGWLAEYFAVLALGAQVYNESTPHQVEAFSILPDQLFGAAQAFLKRTAFMVQPTLASIRTLCLLVIYRQMKSLFCVESDALWPITGMIVRLAIAMGLHSTDPNEDSPDNDIRSALWAAVMFLDLRQSLASGMPFMPPLPEMSVKPLSRTHNASNNTLPRFRGYDCGVMRAQGMYPVVVHIHQSLPIILGALDLSTSGQIFSTYDSVVAYDEKIRQLLKQAHRLYISSANASQSSARFSCGRFQWSMANVFFRRVLLALHSRPCQEPQSYLRYPVSYWSSLECSLALLSEQQNLWETSLCPGDSLGSLVIRFFRQEFFLAATTVCFHMVQTGSPLVLSDNYIYKNKARKTVLETLRSCREIWRVDKDSSTCHGKAFDMIDSLLILLDTNGDDF